MPQSCYWYLLGDSDLMIYLVGTSLSIHFRHQALHSETSTTEDPTPESPAPTDVMRLKSSKQKIQWPEKKAASIHSHFPLVNFLAYSCVRFWGHRTISVVCIHFFAVATYTGAESRASHHTLFQSDLTAVSRSRQWPWRKRRGWNNVARLLKQCGRVLREVEDLFKITAETMDDEAPETSVRADDAHSIRPSIHTSEKCESELCSDQPAELSPSTSSETPPEMEFHFPCACLQNFEGDLKKKISSISLSLEKLVSEIHTRIEDGRQGSLVAISSRLDSLDQKVNGVHESLDLLNSHVRPRAMPPPDAKRELDMIIQRLQNLEHNIGYEIEQVHRRIDELFQRLEFRPV